MKPLLFVDIDGVLNRIGPQFPRKLPKGSGARLYMPEGTPERIDRLLQSFEPIWATEWKGAAQGVWGPLLGLGSHWPYLHYERRKLPRIIRQAGARRWAWVDDRAEKELRSWSQALEGLVVIPEPDVGLTDEHVVELLAFAGEGCR